MLPSVVRPQLRRTGHALGIKSCMAGMQGLDNLLNNIRWNMGPRFLWIWSEGDRYAAHLPPDHWLTAILIWTADDMRVRAGQETLGTPWSWNFASINNLAPGCMWQVMPPAGKVWCRKSNFFPPRHEQHESRRSRCHQSNEWSHATLCYLFQGSFISSP